MNLRHFFLYVFPPSRKFLLFVMYRMQFLMLKMYQDPTVVAFLRSVYAEQECLLQPAEAFALYELSRMQRDVEGAIGEVGTFRGASSKILCEAKGAKEFYGFDTFEGLPANTERDQSVAGANLMQEKAFAAPEEQVAKYLSRYCNVHLIKGFFPTSVTGKEFPKFCLVHLDVDLYQSMKDSLFYFWDRLSPGGVIVMHDYHFPAVQTALKEFTDTLQMPPRRMRTFGTQMLLFKS